MADLAKTASQWKNDFFRRVLAFLQIMRVIRDFEDRLTLEREQIKQVNDFNANFDAVSLSGLKLGTNTTDAGEVIVRVTGVGPYDVKLYKATGGGGGDEIATGSGAAGASVAMSAANDSGVSGTVKLASSVTVETDDKHRLKVYLDWKKHALNVFASDGTTDKDTNARNEFEDLLGTLRAQALIMKASIRDALQRFAIRFEDGTEGYAAEFLLDGSSQLFSEIEQRPGSGEIEQLPVGLLVALKQAMADDSNGEQDVVKLTTAATAGTFSSGNDGQGTVASHTPDEHCPAGRHTFVCVSSEVGRERFEHRFVPSDGRAEGRFTFDGLQVGQSYKGPNGLGPFTLLRTLAKTGDGSNLNLAVVSGFSVSGESDTNTDGGVLYWEIVTAAANPSNWDVSFYRSSNRTTQDLVAKAENVATGAAFVAQAKRGSNLTVNGTVGSGPTTTTQGTIDLQTFKTQNSNNVADSFYIDTTVAAGGGEIQTLFAEELGYHLNSDTAGSETISDDLVQANTFEDYVATS